MTQLLTYAATFLGAVVSDVLALATEMRTGRLKAARWKKGITYVGMIAQGATACLVHLIVLPNNLDPISAMSLGINLPLIVEKLAKLTPHLSQPNLPRDAGFATDSTEFGAGLERVRQFLAKEI